MSLAGRHELAEGCCRHGIAVSQRLGLDVTGQAYLLGMLGDSYNGRGRHQEAIEVLSRALAVFEQHGDRRGQALCLLKVGQAHVALGQTKRAALFLQECLPIFQELGLPTYGDLIVHTLDACPAAGRASAAGMRS